MFKNRKITMTLDKKNKDDFETIEDPEQFEKKVAIVLHQLEKFGVKIALGVCAYVLLDTFRQIAVENATHQD